MSLQKTILGKQTILLSASLSTGTWGKSTARGDAGGQKEQNHSNLPVTCFPPQNIITGGLHADCMLRNVEFDLFPSQISSSVQAFPSDGDSAQWRKQQGRRERNRGRALFQLKLLLRHQFKKDDVILCWFSKLQYGANKNTNLTLFQNLHSSVDHKRRYSEKWLRACYNMFNVFVLYYFNSIWYLQMYVPQI